MKLVQGPLLTKPLQKQQINGEITKITCRVKKTMAGKELGPLFQNMVLICNSRVRHFLQILLHNLRINRELLDLMEINLSHMPFNHLFYRITFLFVIFDFQGITGADAIKKFTPSLGIPYLGV